MIICTSFRANAEKLVHTTGMLTVSRKSVTGRQNFLVVEGKLAPILK